MTVNSCVCFALFIFIQTIIAELTNTDVTIATHPDNIENIEQDLCANDAFSLYDETTIYCATAAQVNAAAAVRYTATGNLYQCKWWTQGNLAHPIDPNGPWALQKECIAWTESFVQGSITPFTVVNVAKDAELVIDIEPYLGFAVGAIYVVVNNMYSTLASKFNNYQLLYTTASRDSSAQLRITFDNIQTPAYKIEIRFTPFVATTAAPSQSPIESPTESPIESPTASPIQSPTTSPVESPTASPIESPSTSPTKSPSSNPSVSPSQNPSISPSLYPSVSPSSFPSASPSRYSDTPRPSQNPSQNPSLSPSVYPSTSPSLNPSLSPSQNPSLPPSQNPTTYTPTYHTWSPTLPPLQANDGDDPGEDDQGEDEDEDEDVDGDGDGSMSGSAGMEKDVSAKAKSTQSVIVFAVLGIIPLFFICMAVCCMVRNCKKGESETSDADTDIYVVSDDDSPSPRLGDVTPRGGVTPNGEEAVRNVAGGGDVEKMVEIHRKFKNAPDVKECDIHMAIDIMFRD